MSPMKQSFGVFGFVLLFVLFFVFVNLAFAIMRNSQYAERHSWIVFGIPTSILLNYNKTIVKRSFCHRFV